MKLPQSMIPYALAVLLLIIGDVPLFAEDSCKNGQTYTNVTTIGLAPNIDEQHSQSTGSYIYHRYSTMVEYELGQRVILTSQEEVEKNIRTDDISRFRNLTTDLEWSHDFRSPDRARIVEIPPQDVTALFEPGTNIVELELEDVMPGFYSSWPYFLVIQTPCGAESTPVPPTFTSTATLTATVTPSRTASATNTLLPTKTATATLVPPTETTTNTPLPTDTATSTSVPPTETATVAASPTPSATATVSPTTKPALVIQIMTPPAIDNAPDSVQPSNNFSWRTIVGVLGLVSLMFGLLAWLLFRKQQIRIPGTLEIYHQGKYVRSMELAMFSQDWITLGPVGDILLPSSAADVTAQARIGCEVDELGDGEVIVEVPVSGSEGEWLPLRSLKDGDTFTIGEYTLKYVNITEQSLEWEGGYAHVSS